MKKDALTAHIEQMVLDSEEGHAQPLPAQNVIKKPNTGQSLQTQGRKGAGKELVSA